MTEEKRSDLKITKTCTNFFIISYGRDAERCSSIIHVQILNKCKKKTKEIESIFIQ